jgi:hypothetical protein
LRIRYIFGALAVVIWGLCSTFDETAFRTGLALLSLVAALVCWRKEYFTSSLEFCGVGLCYWFGLPLTYPIYVVFKLVACLVECCLEVSFNFLSSSGLWVRYLLFFQNAPCHSMVAVGERAYHARGGDTPELYQSKTGDTAFSKAYYMPCIGISLEQDLNAVLRKLELCGKCHDWATVAGCILSAHPFLTYCLVAHARWTIWLLALSGFLLQQFAASFGVPRTVSFLVVDFFFILSVLLDVGNAARGVLHDHESWRWPPRSSRTASWFWPPSPT